MYLIGEAARRSGISVDTLRYYEKESLVMPAARSAAGYRKYDDGAVRRIRFIRHAQHCGFTLAEIRELLALKSTACSCCGDVRSVAIRTRDRVAGRLAALEAMARALDELIARCDGGPQAVEACPILGTLESSLDQLVPCEEP